MAIYDLEINLVFFGALKLFFDFFVFLVKGIPWDENFLMLTI